MYSPQAFAATPTGGEVPALPKFLVDQIVGHFSAGRWQQLEGAARVAIANHPCQLLGWLALGKALLGQAKWEAAIEPLVRVAELSPGDADSLNDLGYAYYRLGREQEAEASYRQGLKADPCFAQAHNNLGALLSDQGRLAEAAIHLKQSLSINPHAAQTHNNLGHVQRRFGWLEDSEASYRRALALDPVCFEARINLGVTLKELGRLEQSRQSYLRALEIRPDSDFALHSLAILFDCIGGRDEEAIDCLERSLALNPAGVDACITLGNLLMRKGELERANELYRRAQALRPLSSRRADKAKADFSVVLLDAPGPGSTPIGYLVGRAPYESHFYCVIPGGEPHVELLRAKGDVVVNLIADADSGKEMLPFVRELVDRLGRPTINHPSLIMETDRESIARRLAGIPRCRIPGTVQFTADKLSEAARRGGIGGFEMPLLVRVAGNHGGDDFEKAGDWQAVADFVAAHPGAEFYLTEYVEYRSADGLYRKYRLISIDGGLLPYHLAIHDDWKVHHFRTDMANQAWMRREEESFLRDMSLVFDQAQQDALRTVAAATGLDYCGIDCGLDRDGRVVVFETNATMLVHDEKDPTFAYKNPYTARIRDAFHAMLARRAASAIL